MERVRSVYRAYITEGGYAISRLLFSIATEPIAYTKGGYLGIASSEVLGIANHIIGMDLVERTFHEKLQEKHKVLFEIFQAVNELMDKQLTHIENRSKYSDYYPQFITETYGRLAPLSKAKYRQDNGKYYEIGDTPANFTLRKNLVERLLSLIEANKKNQYVDFDFSDPKNIAALLHLQDIIADSKSKNNIKLTKKLMRSKYLNYSTFSAGNDIREVVNELTEETELPVDLYHSWLSDDDIEYYTNGDIFTCKFKKLRCVSKYTLYINNVEVACTKNMTSMSFPTYAKPDLFPVKDGNVKVLVERDESDILLLQKAFHEEISRSCRENFLLFLLNDNINTWSSYGLITFMTATMNAISYLFPDSHRHIMRYLHGKNYKDSMKHMWIPTTIRLLQTSEYVDTYDQKAKDTLCDYCVLTRTCFGTDDACCHCYAAELCYQFFKDHERPYTWNSEKEVRKRLILSARNRVESEHLNEEIKDEAERNRLLLQKLRRNWDRQSPLIKDMLTGTSRQTFLKIV